MHSGTASSVELFSEWLDRSLSGSATVTVFGDALPIWQYEFVPTIGARVLLNFPVHLLDSQGTPSLFYPSLL